MDQMKLKRELRDKLGITYLLPHQELVVTHIAMNEENKKETRLLAVLPTGSGKSTTLASMLNLINKTQSKHIMTIEDPIEYVYKYDKAMIHWH